MGSSRSVGTNENISTYGDGTKDYSSVSAWEVATGYDLVTAEVSEILEVYADSPNYDEGNVQFFGATTSPLYRRGIRPAPGNFHYGIPGAGVKFHNVSSNTFVFRVVEDYFFLQDFEVISSVNVSLPTPDIVTLATAISMEAVGLIVSGTNSGAGTINGLTSRTGAVSPIMANCLVYNTDNHGFILDTSGQASYVYNCVAVSNGNQGIRRNNGTIVLKNVLGYNNGTDFFGSFDASCVTNASSDSTAPGTGSRINQTFVFADEPNDDYHLSTLDLGARGYGTDLTLDSVFPFNDDIDKTVISQWWIGFDSQSRFALKRAIDPMILNERFQTMTLDERFQTMTVGRR